MKNFILAATVLAFAGVSTAQAGTSLHTIALQDTVKQDTVKPADTAKKEYAYSYAIEQDTTKKETPADTTKKEEKKDKGLYSEQEPTSDTAQTAPAQTAQEQRKEVKLDELPDVVKQTLTADIFKEWVPTTAYHVTGNAEYYHIEVKNGEEVRNIKIGTDGKVVQ